MRWSKSDVRAFWPNRKQEKRLTLSTASENRSKKAILLVARPSRRRVSNRFVEQTSSIVFNVFPMVGWGMRGSKNDVGAFWPHRNQRKCLKRVILAEKGSKHDTAGAGARQNAKYWFDRVSDDRMVGASYSRRHFAACARKKTNARKMVGMAVAHGRSRPRQHTVSRSTANLSAPA